MVPFMDSPSNIIVIVVSTTHIGCVGCAHCSDLTTLKSMECTGQLRGELL